MPDAAPLDRSLSVRGLARRWAISPRKVRTMIRRRIVRAIDVGQGRQQLRITPEEVAAAENRLAVSPAPKRRSKPEAIDAEIAAMLE